MSAGGAIGAIVGGVIGFVVAGPAGAIYGASIGFSVGMLIDPLTPDVGGIGDPLPDKLGVTPNKIGIPIPDLLGTGSIKGNLLFYGRERNEPIYSETSTGGKGGGSAPKQVSGYSYYMSWGIGICIGEADEIYSIWQDEKCIWSGNLERPVSGGQETIVIEDFGSAIVSFGTQDQSAISSVGKVISDPTLNTPYRGLCWIYFNDCYIGKNNRMPSIRVVLRKTPELSFNTNNVIEVHDYNPAHAIWYILNNLTRLPESWLNEDDFSDMANTLNTDSRGVSILFGKQQKAIDYIESINVHIDGMVLYGNDGEFHPKLIRDDYIPATLPDIDENVLLEEPVFHRGSWIDTINEMKVIYSEIVNPLESHSELMGVGYNTYGNLGLGDSTARYEFTLVDDNEDSYKFSCGETHTMIIKEDGTLWGCGYNQEGELGIETYTYKEEDFVQESSGDTDWDKVFCGWYHTFAIKTDGTLWGTGHNGVGQLGVGDTDNRNVFTRIAIGDLADLRFDKADGGYTHSIFLTTTGYAFCAGNGDALDFGEDKHTITMMNEGGWKDIGCGDNYSLLIAAHNNSLWGTGYNSKGSLGLGFFTSSGYESLTQEATYSTDWDKLSPCMYDSTFAIKTDGTLWGTGLNGDYQLGLDDSDDRHTFTQIGTASDWDKIRTSSYHSIGLKTDGTLWGTGSNWYGNLGIADREDRHVFSQADHTETAWTDVSLGYSFTVAVRDSIPAESGNIDLRESTASPIAIDEGNITLQERVVTKSIKLASFTRNENAVWGSRHMLQKVNYPYAEVKCVVNRNLFRLEVVDCFYFSYAPYNIEDMIYRVIRIEEKDINSEDIIITATEDVYGISNVRVDYTAPEDNTQAVTDYTIEPFDHEQVVESPYVLSGSTTEVIPMACRKSLLDLGFYLYMSIDNGASYFLLDSFPSLMPYGTLVGTYSNDIYTIDNSDTGFTIDFEFIEDLSQYETTTFSNVLAGITNTALLGNELMSVQTITPDVDNKYILTDVIRGRYGTEKENHTNGTEFYFIHPNTLKVINNEIIPNVTRKFKLVPYNNTTTGDIADCSVIELAITGVSKTPYKPTNFMANDGAYAARYTDDVVLTWSPRYRDSGAGIGVPGEVLASTTREGYFRIEVWVSSSNVRDITDIDAATWTYTEAMNISDNGSLASSIIFKLYNFREEDSITYETEAVEVICKKG